MVPTSLVFSDRRSGEVSVVLASVADKQHILAQYPQHSLVEVRAGVPRREGCLLVRDPICNDPSQPDEPAHALICPPHGQKQLSKAAARTSARAARVIELREPLGNQ